MDVIANAFEKMRATQMNDWVGGSDPEAVGEAHANIIRRLLPIDSSSKVLDFGCGIGRGMLSLLKGAPQPEKIVGLDIMPPVIEFCRENIEPNFPNTSFELADDSNDHYDRFIGDVARKPKTELAKQYENYFSDAYAFSVFTHIDRKDFQDLLEFVGKMLMPGGRFLFTCFTLTEFSRHMIERGQAVFPLQDGAFVDDGKVLWGNRHDPLAFIAFDKMLLEEMAWKAGLAVMKVEYGCWMGGNIGSSLHDLVVVTKPLALQNADNIVYTPVVDRNSFT
jgi:SAM-dependent methyltransferase